MSPFTVVPMDASKLLDFIDKQNIELCSKSHVGNSGVDKFANFGNDEQCKFRINTSALTLRLVKTFAWVSRYKKILSAMPKTQPFLSTQNGAAAQYL